MTKNDNTKNFSRPNLLGVPMNKTTAFMLPALNLSSEKTGFKMLEYFGFVNCYIDHKQSLVSAPDSVYMVFNPVTSALKNFNKFFDVYRSYPNFVDDYVIDNNLIVVVFKIKEKWKLAYKEFKNSNYSKMTKEYAELFKKPDNMGRTSASMQYFIITKHKEYKAYLERELGLDFPIEDSAELMDRLDLDKEIFDYEYTDTKQLSEVLPREGEREARETPGDRLYLLPS